jgi:hypothetical protein
MPLIMPMKRQSLSENQAPSPRLTLWVPVILATLLGLAWLALVALLQR